MIDEPATAAAPARSAASAAPPDAPVALKVHLKDRRMAALCFTPWMQRGGLFVASAAGLGIGTAVKLTVHFGAQPEMHVVGGHVAALTFDMDSTHVPGAYVQFGQGDAETALRHMLERSVDGLGVQPAMFVRRAHSF